MRNLASQKEHQIQHQSESVYDKLRMFNGQSGGWAWYPANLQTAAAAATVTCSTANVPTQLSIQAPSSITNITASNLTTSINGNQLIRDDSLKRGNQLITHTHTYSQCNVMPLFSHLSLSLSARVNFSVFLYITRRMRCTNMHAHTHHTSM